MALTRALAELTAFLEENDISDVNELVGLAHEVRARSAPGSGGGRLIVRGETATPRGLAFPANRNRRSGNGHAFFSGMPKIRT